MLRRSRTYRELDHLPNLKCKTMQTTATRTRKKTAKKTARGRPFKVGADPRRGAGMPGRSGRKPAEFIKECADIADNVLLPKLREKIEKGDLDDPAFRWAADKVLDYSKSKAPLRSEVSGADNGDCVIRVVYDDPEAHAAQQGRGGNP
jgi:hypothetical protein